MTASKSIITVSTLAFALIFGGGIYLYTQLNALAKPLTERIASDALGVAVTIGEMDIRLKDKRVDVRNIKVANPSGFKKPNAITISEVTVALSAIATNSVNIEDVAVKGTDVYLEVTSQGTNLSKIQNNLKKVKSDGPVEEAIKVIIERFSLDGAMLHPSITLLSNRDLKSVQVSPIVLRNIGKADNGILAQDAVAQIMRPILKELTKKAGDAGYYEGLSSDVLKDIGASDFEQIKGQVTEEVDKFKKLFQ